MENELNTFEKLLLKNYIKLEDGRYKNKFNLEIYTEYEIKMIFDSGKLK